MSLPTFAVFHMRGNLPKPPPTIHILIPGPGGPLRGGTLLCDSSYSPPEFGGKPWPPGHQWISQDHPECAALANCPECRRLAAREGASAPPADTSE